MTTHPKRPVRKMTAREAAAVSALFGKLMDELKGYVPDNLRESYCRLHDVKSLREMLRDERSVVLSRVRWSPSEALAMPLDFGDLARAAGNGIRAALDDTRVSA